VKNIFTNTRISIITVLLSVAFLQSCGIYSFTGASISSDVKTVQISSFPNYSQLINPALEQTFTLGLQDLFLNQTNLNLVGNNGDLQFEGEITEYRVTPSSNTANSTAAQNRLTVTVKVRFYNNKDEEQNFEKSFSHFQDFDANQSLSGSVENTIVDEILEIIFENIFNEAVANW